MVLLMVMMVEFLAVLMIMSFTKFSGVLRLGLGLDVDESVVLQLLDLLLSEVTNLRLGIRAVTVFLSHLFSGLLSILRLVLAALLLFISFSTLPISLVLSSSSTSVVVVSLLVVSSFSLSWLLIIHLRLNQRSSMLFHCNLWRFLDLLGCHNWSWSLYLWLRHCHNCNRSLNNHWCVHWLFLDNFLDRFGFDLHLFFKNITHNLFLIADNRSDMSVSVFLNVSSQ